jgi:4-carboxymuconolactone decarboxylase
MWRSISDAMFMRLNKARIQPVDRKEIIAQHKDALALEPRIVDITIYRTLLNHPKLFKRWFVFCKYILEDSTLPPRDRELLMLRVGWLCQAEYEWAHHAINGRKAGLADEEIKRIAEEPIAEGWSRFDATLLQSVDELKRSSIISDATWRALMERYSQEQVMDLVFTVGEYILVSIALNSFGVQLEEGVEGFPEGSRSPP